MKFLRILYVLLATVCISFIALHPLKAQSPRMSLVEEMTNVHCGPCEEQNPVFEKWFNHPRNVDRFATIVYHMDFPGTDPMNLVVADAVKARQLFYDLWEVPTAAVNGRIDYPGWSYYTLSPGDTTALESLVAEVDDTMSPITITITQTGTGDPITAEVKVSTTEKLEGQLLYVVLTEGYHHYTDVGSTGEEHFYRTVRRVLSDKDGESVFLLEGQSMTLPVSFTLDPEWNTDDLRLVAFVQESVGEPRPGREVLQAGQFGPLTIEATSVDPVRSVPDAILINAYPNPAHGITHIPVTLNRTSKATLQLYNTYGQLVKTLFDGTLNSGTMNFHLDTGSLPAGVYMLRVHSGPNTASTMVRVVH